MLSERETRAENIYGYHEKGTEEEKKKIVDKV